MPPRRCWNTVSTHTLSGKGLPTDGLPGERFTHLPDTHLSEFTDAMEHGEIPLMVDASPERANEVEHCIQDHYPEAVAGGSSWNTPMLGT